MTSDYKTKIIQGAIDGMQEAGLPDRNVKLMQALLEMIYDIGYEEGVRNMLNSPIQYHRDREW